MALTVLVEISGLDYTLTDIIDIKTLERLAGLLYRATNIPLAILAPDGTILVDKGWQDICLKYHRTHPETARRCVQSDRSVESCLSWKRYHSYKCQNGLRDIAIPLIIEDEHVATLFLGQFFYDDEPPDREWFRHQAREFGFDEDAYLSALDCVPVLSRSQVDAALASFLEFSDTIIELVMTALRLKRAETSVSQREERYQRLVQGMKAIIVRMDKNGIITFCNEFGLSFFGYEAGELIGNSAVGTIVPERESSGRDLDAMIRDIGEHPERYATNENENICKNGDRVWVLWKNTPIYDSDGQFTEILCVGTDMTARRESEDALRKSETWLHAVQRIANIGMYEFDLETGPKNWSAEAYAISRRDPALGGTTYEEYVALVHPDDREEFSAEFERAIATRDRFDLVYRLLPDTGEEVFVHNVVQALYDENGKPQGFFGIVMDITEQRLAEVSIEASLHEKEALLREIHHRVKNNLQIISSLLMLQRDRTDDSENRRIFEISINRVKTMSLIHEHLYRSKDIARINVRDYIVRVCDNVRQLEHDHDRIVIEYDIDDISLTMDTAIPFGLMVNELVTNAFRHGFDAGDEGAVTIIMHRTEKQYIITISDTGRGIPQKYDWHQSRTLGLRLVESLAVEQLGGDMTLTDPDHASFTITFPISF